MKLGREFRVSITVLTEGYNVVLYGMEFGGADRLKAMENHAIEKRSDALRKMAELLAKAEGIIAADAAKEEDD